MKCSKCQTELPDQANFCFRCGEPVSAAATGERIDSRGDQNINVIGGVQGGIHVVNELPPKVLDLFAHQFGFDPRADDATALKTYFDNVVFEKHSKLSFLFIQPVTGKVYTEADVETVFVPLRMTDPEALERQARLARDLERFDRRSREIEEAARPITLPEVLTKYPCFLLRGKPGCGKTTLLRHIALAFARGEQKEKLNWRGPVPLPLMVSLRNFGAFLKGPKGRRFVEPQPKALLTYLEDHLRGAGVRFSPDFISRRLDDGQCFLLLDALDEASGTLEDGADLRAAVARQVSAFIRHYAPRGNRFALTSRPRAYQDEGDMRRALPEPQVCDVFDLDANGYMQLIANLLVVLTGNLETGRAEANDLFARITPNRHLADLAGNPLLCTTLVLVYKYRGRKLPERRVDVLHEIITLLLGRWEEEKRELSSPEGLALEGTTARTSEQAIEFRRRALTALAWRMQQDHTPEAPVQIAVKTLVEFYCDEERVDKQKAAVEWAHAFLDTAHERSGLFIAIDQDLYTFAHQAFREYLVATHLVNAGEERLNEEILRHAPEPDDWWEQVVLLAGAHPELPGSAAGRLIERLLSQSKLDYAYLAARFAQDMTDKLPGAQRKKLQDRLASAMQDSKRQAPDRALAGRALSLAGDPRPGVGVCSPSPAKRERGPGGEVPDIHWADIPAGTLLMGSRRGETFTTPKGTEQPYDEEYWPDGRPRAIQIRAFKLSAYPITVAQFRPFVREGWTNDEWWTKDGLKDRGDSQAPYYWDDPQWCIDNHPVVGMTWYAAVAFCNWLTAQLRATSDPQFANALVRLPTEAEWEWAARGPEGRRWPWGDDWREDACNSAESQIGRTSVVRMFLGGVNWTGGVYDLAGNVWEWCSTKWQEYGDGYPALKGVDEWAEGYLEGRDLRVIRGGSFDDVARSVRGAFRYGSVPRVWDWDLEFRCAQSVWF